MDTGNGVFEQLKEYEESKVKEAKNKLEDKHPNHGGWFTVGEILVIRGSRFKVQAVKANQLRLKLLRKKA